MTLTFAFAVVVAAFLAAWVATILLLPVLRRHMMDHPNYRSSHTVPTPRSGGIGIVAGLAAGLAVAAALGLPVPRWEVLVGVGLMAIVGFVDDQRRGIGTGVRFLLQFGAAALVVIPASRLAAFPLPWPLDVRLGPFALPLSVLWIVGMTNVYNFLDGIDGYAGLQAVVAGLAMAVFAGSGPIAVGGLAAAGAGAGFLLLNWKPAKIFMGDVASGALGFLFASLPFELPGREQPHALFFVAAALWFFLSDGVFTFTRRLLNHEKVWEAHRSHLYQRLVITGLGHDTVVLRVLAVGAVIAFGTAVGIRDAAANVVMWIVCAAAAASFAWLYVWTVRRESSSHG